MIYAMTMDEGRFVKIGFTAKPDLEKRATQLQTGNPYYIKVEFGVTGSLIQERELHRATKAALHRIRIPVPGNEWYPARHPFMKELINQLRLGGVVAATNHADSYNASVKQWGKSVRFRDKNRIRELHEFT